MGSHASQAASRVPRNPGPFPKTSAREAQRLYVAWRRRRDGNKEQGRSPCSRLTGAHCPPGTSQINSLTAQDCSVGWASPPSTRPTCCQHRDCTAGGLCGGDQSGNWLASPPLVETPERIGRARLQLPGRFLVHNAGSAVPPTPDTRDEQIPEHILTF